MAAVRAWRLLKTRHLAHALTGEGARRFGGRWNSPGTPVVYASEHVSLALLEVLVHLQSAGPLAGYSLVPLSMPSRLITDLDPADLPPDWRASPPPRALAALGDAWAREQRSAVLRVPSALVPEESNYLLNPAHGDFGKIEAGAARVFGVDERLGW